MTLRLDNLAHNLIKENKEKFSINTKTMIPSYELETKIIEISLINYKKNEITIRTDNTAITLPIHELTGRDIKITQKNEITYIIYK